MPPQRVELPAFGPPVDITSPWRFQQSDDAHYADPGFDDSKWTVVSTSEPLSSYGLYDLDLVWYRKRLHVVSGSHGLALMYMNLGGTFEIFVNGVQLGRYGRSIQGGSPAAFTGAVIAIPDALLAGGDLTIAIRASTRRALAFSPNGLFMTRDTLVRIGSAEDISNSRSLYDFRAVTSAGLNLLLEGLLAILSLTLALTLRRDREYLALFLSATMGCYADVSLFSEYFRNSPTSMPIDILRSLIALAGTLALFEFIRIVLRLRRSPLLVAYLLLITIARLADEFALARWTFFGDGGHYPSVVLYISRFVDLPATYLLPFLALWIALRRRNRDAFLLFFPLLINSAWSLYLLLQDILVRLHGPVLPDLIVPIPGFFVQPYEVFNFLYTLTLLIFVVLRTVSIAGERAKIAAEVEAARTMQQLLLARSSEPTPGFEVETVYLPAGEVGGDFFLVSPGPDQSLTAIVGDVSGKGLAAAMRVSMILGVLRREDSRHPATILARLNEALLAQSEAGFTTACCVRLDREGGYTIANAGHISPYVAGKEIQTPPMFPLGLAGAQVYAAVEGQLNAGERLVLMSDGVVEARSAKGELYGFDRVAALSVKNAKEIAETAQGFGQDDDITVLTIACA